MTLVYISLILPLLGGLLSLVLPRFSKRLGVLSITAGAFLALLASATFLFSDPHDQFFDWPILLGSGHIGIDSLSAFFIIPIALVSGCAAIFGSGYLPREKSTGTHWFWYNFLFISLIGVMIARDGLLFLVFWELMSLSSFFLVLCEGEKAKTRRAAWIYLVATHIGTGFLLLLFARWGLDAHSFNFVQLQAAGPSTPLSFLFICSLVGFGTKAGLIPLHIWLPEAHPAAPSHVSALLSGVMIKTGIYGLIRVSTMLTPSIPVWWAFVFITIGAIGGNVGVLFALAQHDLKRLLAYHSVENIGIIAIGIGLGMLGQTYQLTTVSLLGYAGALLHVTNHALFKSLLFLGSGAVIHQTKTREIDCLGGLLKKMPWTGSCFLVGATAISGLPPLNGFVSEFLIFLSAILAILSPSGNCVIGGVFALSGLSLIGGLAMACFAKAFGIVFLGEPRSDHVSSCMEVGWLMRGPMVALALLCFAIALSAPWLLTALANPLRILVPESQGIGGTAFFAVESLYYFVLVIAVFGLASAGLFWLKQRAMVKLGCRTSVTWDCGYAAPTARMQYSASSFAKPLTDLFQFLLRTRSPAMPVPQLFPGERRISTETPDLFQESVYRPIYLHIRRLLAHVRETQHGHLQLYLLVVILTLLALLAFNRWSL